MALMLPVKLWGQNENPVLKWQFGVMAGSLSMRNTRETKPDGRSSLYPLLRYELGILAQKELKKRQSLLFGLTYHELNVSAGVAVPGFDGRLGLEEIRFGHSVEATFNYRRSFWRNFFAQSGVGLLYLANKSEATEVQFTINQDRITHWSLTPRIDHKLAPIVLLGVGKSFIFYGKEKAKHQFDFLIQARAGLRHMGEIPFTYTDERGTFHHNQQIYGHALTLRMAYLLGIKKRDKE